MKFSIQCLFVNKGFALSNSINNNMKFADMNFLQYIFIDNFGMFLISTILF